MASVSPLYLGLLLALLAVGTGGKGRLARYEIYVEVNESVMIPGEKLTDKNYHELRKEGGTREMVAMYHGWPMLDYIYEGRGQFFRENGSFQLCNLTKNDSGTYKHLVNHKLRVETKLIVIGPVETPVLQVLTEIHRETCQITLQCVGSGEHTLHVSFLRTSRGEHSLSQENITRTGNSSLLLLDSYDPDSWGTYTCCLENPVSRKTSAGVQVHAQDCKSTAKRTYISTIIFVLVILPLFLVICYICFKLYKKKANAYQSTSLAEGDGAGEENRLEDSHFQVYAQDADDPDGGSGVCG